MFVATKGILLRKIKYSEKSILVKIYCEKYGMLTFIVNNAFSKKNHLNQSLFSNLALLDLTFNFQPEKKILFLKEAVSYFPFKDIPFSIEKNSVLLFYNELLYKLLYQADADPALFALIEGNLMELDSRPVLAPDFHIRFLVDLIKSLGISPINNFSEKNCFFSIEENNFSQFYNENRGSFDKETSAYFSQLLDKKLIPYPKKSIRMATLSGLINYLRVHNEQIGELESVKILSEVFKN